MTRLFMTLLMLCPAALARADAVTPSKTIRADTIITEADVQPLPGVHPNAYGNIADVIGQEARTTLYAGRPILYNDVGPPALVMRNQIVQIQFNSGGLTISTEGRSLERGGVGDRVRIMNLSSRSTLFGQVQQDGTVKVFK